MSACVAGDRGSWGGAARAEQARRRAGGDVAGGGQRRASLHSAGPLQLPASLRSAPTRPIAAVKPALKLCGSVSRFRGVPTRALQPWPMSTAWATRSGGWRRAGAACRRCCRRPLTVPPPRCRPDCRQRAAPADAQRNPRPRHAPVPTAGGAAAGGSRRGAAAGGEEGCGGLQERRRARRAAAAADWPSPSPSPTPLLLLPCRAAPTPLCIRPTLSRSSGGWVGGWVGVAAALVLFPLAGRMSSHRHPVAPPLPLPLPALPPAARRPSSTTCLASTTPPAAGARWTCAPAAPCSSSPACRSRMLCGWARYRRWRRRRRARWLTGGAGCVSAGRKRARAADRSAPTAVAAPPTPTSLRTPSPELNCPYSFNYSGQVWS